MSEATPTPTHPPAPELKPPPATGRSRWAWTLAGLMTLVVLASLVLGWSAEQRVRKLELELVRRQQESQSLSGEARLLAKRADETARESAAKVSLLEARVAEVAIQRTQLEDLIQSLARSRDENVLIDIDAGLRVAQQQATVMGSAEPLVAALKQADERLARYGQPRLDGVRRAIARDIDRVKAVGVADVAVLSAKLDEAMRMIDELPLISQADLHKEIAKPAAAVAVKPVANPASGVAMEKTWSKAFTDGWAGFVDRVWEEARGLVRVTRIDSPDAMLLAPDQAFFLRENLKLRLLNARLALMSRQFATVQTDVQGAQLALGRYFDGNSRRTGVAIELLKQVTAGARQVGLPRPDDTLAALSAATAGR